MRKFILLTVVLFLSYQTYSQSTLTPVSDWTVVTTDATDVTIYKRDVKKTDQKNDSNNLYEQYRFENNSNSDVFINWNFTMKYSNIATETVPGEENYRALYLAKNQNFIPDYFSSNEKLFFVFKSFLNNKSDAKLESCRLDNLTIKIL
ncbi:hypothetical protein [Aurantibacter aestuarii]|uniref:Uncharacterized protein n=1 Tax=Aurantibacter aestuarii TaxID=1266046 RepID=A0A2T1N8L6_9FLAO|nr:hypothetical protein [Aurantibacter aestuarii]PSG88206.1 hypothetical protein C7H52_07830 [Aurantibacter aestuarii]